MKLNDVKSNLIMMMCVGYVIYFLLDTYFVVNTYWFRIILTLLVIAIFILCLLGASSFPKYFSFFMFSSATVLTLYKGEGITGLTNVYLHFFPFVSMIVLVPLLSIPLKEEGYYKSVHYYIESWNNNIKRIFVSIAAFLFLLGPILNVGTIRIVHDMITDLKLNQRMLASAYITGFSTVLTWSPFFASVALVLSLLNVSVITFLPLGLPVAFTELLLGSLIFLLCSKKMMKSKEKRTSSSISQDDTAHRRNILFLFLMLVSIVGAIFMVEWLMMWPIIFAVTVVSLLTPMIWALIRSRWDTLIKQFANYKANTLPFMNNEIVFFLSGGMFGIALTGTALSEGIQSFITIISSQSFVFFMLFVYVMVVVSGLIGISPIVVITVLLPQIDPAMIGTSPEVIALLFTTALTINSIVSPVAPGAVLISSLIQRSTFEISFKWNYLYLLSLLLLAGSFIYIIH